MAKKPTISTISSGYYSRQALNTNFENLRDAFDNTLSLDGSTPNAMQADLDMNNNDILNAQEISTNGLRIDGVLIGSSDIAAAGASLYSDSYTGDGTTVAYTMSYQPFIKDNTQVYIDGVYQAKDGYTISGTTLTFSEAPPLNSDIEIVVARSLDFSATDASNVGYTQGGTGSVNTTVEAKLQEFVSVKDFGAVGDGVTDDTAAIQAADNAAKSVRACVFFPYGTYRVTSTLERTTQSAWVGQSPQAGSNFYNKVQILGNVADIGDGNPIVESKNGTGSTQGILYQNLTFVSDKSINPSDLSLIDSSGVVGVNIRGTKQGMQFVNCAFKNMKSAVRDDIGTGDYQDKVTFTNCYFQGHYLAVQCVVTAGVSFNNCFFDECFNWVDAGNSTIHLNSSRCNNSSFGSENCQFKADTIIADNFYVEGGNNWFVPNKYLSVRGSYFSEAFSASGSTKVSIKVVSDNVFVNLEGVRVGTNTRLFDINNSNIPNTSIRMRGLYNGSNFGLASSNIDYYLQRLLTVDGKYNTQSAWNLVRQNPPEAADSTEIQVQNGRVSADLFYSNPGGSTVTKTIILRGKTTPGVCTSMLTIHQVALAGDISARRSTQFRVFWSCEGSGSSGRAASVTEVFDDNAPASSGTTSTGKPVITATASLDTENIVTIDVDITSVNLGFGKLYMTLNSEVAFD